MDESEEILSVPKYQSAGDNIIIDCQDRLRYLANGFMITGNDLMSRELQNIANDLADAIYQFHQGFTIAICDKIENA